MQFTSLAYLGFFAAVFAVHWAVPQKARWAVCLAASAGFYALLGAPMLAVLALCIAVSYLGGLWLQRRRGRRPALALAAAAALAPLLFFKYFNTLLGAYVPESVRAFSLLTPVGISFFTFKAVAYLAEVYKGALPPCRHFGRYALYVSFFPEVSMGPIQRPGDLMAQIGTPRAFDAGRAVRGAQLMLWGYFEKLVVADNLAPYVSAGLDAPDLVMGLSVFLASVLYAVQLYADFAGYSHIAIGCMQLLGFDVPENFRAPYFSTSVKEFWNRWHISLSSWLRDDVYIPLGGSRCSTARCCVNLLITFLVSGLWHGTGLQFAVWGLLHGAYLAVGRLTAPARARLWRASHIPEQSAPARGLKMLVTFVLVWFGWVFFRAPTLSGALHLFARMPDSFSLAPPALKNALAMLGFNSGMLVRVGFACALLCAVDFAARRTGFSAWLAGRRKWFQAALCYVLVLAILFLAPIGASPTPIYFQF